ncbi:hypothetical protein H5410_014528, partial [Solanum commersonii]
WHTAKDAARALKEYVKKLFTQAYHSWSEIPNSIRQAIYNEFKVCTWEPKYNMVIVTIFERRASTRLSNWLKKAQDTDQCPSSMLPRISSRRYPKKPKWLEAILRKGHFTPEVQRALEQFAREMEK